MLVKAEGGWLELLLPVLRPSLGVLRKRWNIRMVREIESPGGPAPHRAVLPDHALAQGRLKISHLRAAEGGVEEALRAADLEASTWTPQK